MIINSVIAGKAGGGDEVEAYALGDAKNAVKDDKVTLNFSADIPLGSEDFLVPATWNSSMYMNPRYAAYVDSEYIYYSAPSTRDNIYAYNKETGERTTLLNYSSTTQYFISQFGLTSSGTSSSEFKQFIAGRMYNLNLACYSFYANTSDGKIAIVCNSSYNGYAADYSVLMKDSEGFYSQIVYFSRVNKGFPIALLDSEDNVNYPLLCSTGSDIITYNINTATKTLDLVGSISNTTFSNSYYFDGSHLSASLGDITFRFARSSNFAYFNVFRAVKDENGVYDVEFLNDLRQQVIDYLTLLGLSDSYYCCGFVGNILCLQNSGRSVGNGNAFIKVDPDALTITGYDFAPEADMARTGLYGNGYSIAYQGIEGSNQKYTVGFMQPIEQPYVATLPQTDRFFANQTLTGIVRENDNGVLKVSTVEDPNNPPPAVPDEAGLKTVINYGGGLSINPNLVISSGITKSGTNLSGFTNNSSYKVTTDSPFTSLSSVSFFDIVMCATHPADNGFYHWLAGLTDDANAYRGFDIRTEGNNFLEANIYHEDGTSSYFKSETTLPTNTKTFIKLSYNSSSGYTMSFSSDGVSYTQVASVTTTKPMELTPPILYLGWRPPKQQSTYYWNGTIHLADCYIKVNGAKIWSGVKPTFGSVGVGYGYFKNTYFYPLGGQASKDKYVPYEGGLLTENDIWPKGSRATTMNIVLGRNADLGSWTSDTKGYLSTQEAVAAAVSKKLPTPVYLWHDLSYITPAVPETIEAVVETGGQTETPSAVNGTIEGSPTIGSDFSVSGFSSSNYIQSADPFRNKDVTSFETVLAFSVPSDNVYQILMIIINALTKGRKTLSFDVAYSTSLLAKVETVNGQSVSISCGAPTAGKKTWLKLTYDSSSGYAVYTSYDGISYTMTGSDTITDKPDVGGADIDTQTILGANLYPGAESQYTRGTIYLPDCYININGQRVWDGVVYEISKGSVSIPTASWKTLDGVVYEYPNGFPKTQASDLEANIVEGSNNLYATRTGDSCGLAISSTSPTGVDSSAVIGTVELDANGAITSYTPGE